jgi:hypothetical protein
MFGFDAGKIAQNANITGLIIAIAALAAFAVWEEWLNLIVGPADNGVQRLAMLEDLSGHETYRQG